MAENTLPALITATGGLLTLAGWKVIKPDGQDFDQEKKATAVIASGLSLILVGGMTLAFNKLVNAQGSYGATVSQEVEAQPEEQQTPQDPVSPESQEPTPPAADPRKDWGVAAFNDPAMLNRSSMDFRVQTGIGQNLFGNAYGQGF